MAGQPTRAAPRTRRRWVSLLAGLLGAAASASVPGAMAAGLFVGMAGTWGGDGSLKWSTGEVEALRCRATYEVTNDGNKLVQNLTCATASTRLIIKSDITYKPDAGIVTGTWAETSYGMGGWLRGNASPGNIQAIVESGNQGFAARVSVVLRGSSEQIVTILPQNLEVTEVSVTLRRTG